MYMGTGLKSVSEMHKNVDLVLRIKNVFELEGVINLRDCMFQFLEQIPANFSKRAYTLKPKQQRLIKVKAPYIDEISGLAIVKILHGATHSTIMIKLKFTQNSATLDIANNGQDIIILKSEEVLGILDLRSLGYYKIKHAYCSKT